MSDSIQSWLNAAGRVQMLSKSEILELAKMRDKYEPKTQQYVRIVNKITEHNLRLVANVVRVFVNKRAGMTMGSDIVSDLLQVGYFGLRRAAEKFDPTMGYSFSTYATPWIRQAVQRWSMSHESTVKIPESTMREVLYRMKHGKPSDQRGVTKSEHLVEAAIAGINVRSLDVRLNDDDNATLADLIGDEHRLRPVTSEYSDPTLKLRELMNECGIDPQVQDLMSRYARRGNLAMAATKAKVKVKEARAIVNEATATLRAAFLEKEAKNQAYRLQR